MSENPLIASNLNDFIFCPASLYFHGLDSDTDKLMCQDDYQLNGTAAHEKSDNGQYSTRKSVMQAISVYCEKYDILGKIDTFDCENGILTERKKKIVTIYDGYVFQLYAQYFALEEMGYSIIQMRLYSMEDNKVYPIELPNDNKEMLQRFEKVIADIQSFEIKSFRQTNPKKCSKCIYEPLCSYSANKEVTT